MRSKKENPGQKQETVTFGFWFLCLISIQDAYFMSYFTHLMFVCDCEMILEHSRHVETLYYIFIIYCIV